MIFSGPTFSKTIITVLPVPDGIRMLVWLLGFSRSHYIYPLFFHKLVCGNIVAGKCGHQEQVPVSDIRNIS